MEVTKKILKKIYREYIFGASKDHYKMRDGSSWDKMIPMFAFNLKEADREKIHDEYRKQNNFDSNEFKKAA
jgi:hypothetical protein